MLTLRAWRELRLFQCAPDASDVAIELHRFRHLPRARTGQGDRHDFLHRSRTRRHDGDAVGQQNGLSDVMGDEHDGLLVLQPEVLQHHLVLFARQGIERAEWLVH